MKVAIIGAGVIGVSSALAIKQKFPGANITIISDQPFENSCSYGAPGMFAPGWPEYREWAVKAFERFAHLHKAFGPSETGVKLVSGFWQSDDEESLKRQNEVFGDIVYSFRFLTQSEQRLVFASPMKFAVSYTTYVVEGKIYVPWMLKEVTKLGGVEFRTMKVESVKQLINSEDCFDLVVNCAGLNGGKVAGDDDSVCPSRGVIFEVKASGNYHFLFRGGAIYCIPLQGTVVIGTVAQRNNWNREVSEEDRRDVWERYAKLQPTLKKAEIVKEWCGLRPFRPDGIRLESSVVRSDSDRKCQLIHNYGHNTFGIQLSWACALEVLKMIEVESVKRTDA